MVSRMRSTSSSVSWLTRRSSGDADLAGRSPRPWSGRCHGCTEARSSRRASAVGMFTPAIRAKLPLLVSRIPLRGMGLKLLETRSRNALAQRPTALRKRARRPLLIGRRTVPESTAITLIYAFCNRRSLAHLRETSSIDGHAVDLLQDPLPPVVRQQRRRRCGPYRPHLPCGRRPCLAQLVVLARRTNSVPAALVADAVLVSGSRFLKACRGSRHRILAQLKRPT